MTVHLSAAARLINLPLKLGVASGSKASISPHAAIHHLIRTPGCSAQTRGLPKSREKLRAPSSLKPFGDAVVVYKSVKLGCFLFFFLAIHNLFNSPRLFDHLLGGKKNLNASGAGRGAVVYYHGNPVQLDWDL